MDARQTARHQMLLEVAAPIHKGPRRKEKEEKQEREERGKEEKGGKGSKGGKGGKPGKGRKHPFFVKQIADGFCYIPSSETIRSRIFEATGMK